MTDVFAAFQAQELVRRHKDANPSQMEGELKAIYKEIEQLAKTGVSLYYCRPTIHAEEIKVVLKNNGYEVDLLGEAPCGLSISWKERRPC